MCNRRGYFKAHCSQRLFDAIEEIGHYTTNIEWSSDEDSDWRSLTYESFRTFTNHSTFGNFLNFIFTSSQFTCELRTSKYKVITAVMSWRTSFRRLGNFSSLQMLLQITWMTVWHKTEICRSVLYFVLYKKNLLQHYQIHCCQCQSHSSYWLMNLMLDVRNDRVRVLHDQVRGRIGCRVDVV